MNPETDAELIDRVINDELAGDSFDTQVEELAYARHLDSRELVDTEANRATWIAARTYYDAEATNDLVVELGGVHFTQEQWDFMVRWRDEKVSYSEAPKVGVAAIAYNDLMLRQQALSYASQNVNGENTASTMARAKAYLKFLQSGGEEG